ncbi:MAG: hypothetical protein B7Y45_01490 [Sphingomonas sp. 28-66-16]|nr:MAG: hypothetical protein B7Y45_01490 [Sphingomonas sp. 28-66-16]
MALAALLLIAAPAIAAPAKRATPRAPVARDWTQFVRQTPQGYFVLGNPAARVKIVEYLSFTCPHCAHFAAESAAVLKGQMIRSGSTSIEYRPIGRDQIDLGATLLARCAGTAGFVGAAEEIFARQDDWLGLGINFLQRDAGRFALDTPLEQVRAGAQSTGLVDLMRARGLSDARIDACFADRAALTHILMTGETSRKLIDGTPTFFVNGTKAPASDWTRLEPILRAAGGR